MERNYTHVVFSIYLAIFAALVTQTTFAEIFAILAVISKFWIPKVLILILIAVILRNKDFLIFTRHIIYFHNSWHWSSNRDIFSGQVIVGNAMISSRVWRVVSTVLNIIIYTTELFCELILFDYGEPYSNYSHNFYHITSFICILFLILFS